MKNFLNRQSDYFASIIILICKYLQGFRLKFDDDTLQREIKRIASECRLQSRGLKPSLALIRAAASLNSLIESLSTESVKDSPLTKREKEVLFHVSQGFTNREIASAFYLSEKTIEFHLKSVFTKTQAGNRTEAVNNALKNQWI